MRENMVLLKKYLSFRDYWILHIFQYINTEIGNNYYEVDKETLMTLCEYLKNKDIQKLKQIWGEKSIQFDIFEFCEFSYEYFSKNFEFSEEKFQESLPLKLKNSLIKGLLLSFYDELHSQYLIEVKGQDDINSYSYLDIDFDVHYLKDIEKIEIKEIYPQGDVFFYLIVDGMVKYDNKLLTSQNMVITTKKIKELGLEPFATKSTIVIFVIKKQFLNKLDINIELPEDKVYKMCNMALFNMILSKKKIDSTNSLKLFQLVLYLLEKINNGRAEVLNLEWMKYKSDIIEFVENNSNLDEKEIGERMLERLDMSLSKMYKVFKFLFNMTPGKYIEKVKISKSYKLIVESSKSIEDIAVELGYNLKTFTRKFEDVSGYSPSKFRKIMRDS